MLCLTEVKDNGGASQRWRKLREAKAETIGGRELWRPVIAEAVVRVENT